MENLKGIHRFIVEHEPTCGEITVFIDFDKMNDFGKGLTPLYQSIIEMVEFWSGCEERLSENDGNYLHTFLKKLCQEVLVVQLEYNLNINGIISHFHQKEGYLPLDGSYGILLIDYSEMELSRQEDYRIRELQLSK